VRRRARDAGRRANIFGPFARASDPSSNELERIRVNCLVTDWVATPQVKSYFESLTPDERREGKVPDVLTTLDEVAAAIVELVTNDQFAGRVMVCWSGKAPGLIPFGDPGYAVLERLSAPFHNKL
jgi:hypothetical protein